MTVTKRATWMGAILGLLLMVGCGAPNSTQTNGGTGTTGNANAVNTSTSSGMAIGGKAPNFSLPQMDGKGNVSLKQLLGQKPIIINAWASWCGPCQREQPDLLAFAKQYAGKVTVIGVNMTSEDSLSGAKKFVSQYHVTYPVLMDTKDSFYNSYQLVGFPTTYLISPSGKIEAMHAGILTKDQMKSLFQQAASL